MAPVELLKVQVIVSPACREMFLTGSVPPLLDSQVSTICKDYYSDESFCKNESGDINLWKLYNLFTGANKSSYVDTFLERGVGSHSFVKVLQEALKSDSEHWFVS